jgi:hypothetical protein
VRKLQNPKNGQKNEQNGSGVITQASKQAGNRRARSAGTLLFPLTLSYDRKEQKVGRNDRENVLDFSRTVGAKGCWVKCETSTVVEGMMMNKLLQEKPWFCGRWDGFHCAEDVDHFGALQYFA